MICLKTEIELSRVILNGTTNRFLRHFFYTYIWLREPVYLMGLGKDFRANLMFSIGSNASPPLLSCSGSLSKNREVIKNMNNFIIFIVYNFCKISEKLKLPYGLK